MTKRALPTVAILGLGAPRESKPQLPRVDSRAQTQTSWLSQSPGSWSGEPAHTAHKGPERMDVTAMPWLESGARTQSWRFEDAGFQDSAPGVPQGETKCAQSPRQDLFERTASAPSELLSPTRAGSSRRLKSAAGKGDFCQKHPNMAMTMWCETCSVMACIRCAHIGHSVMDSTLYFLSRQSQTLQQQRLEEVSAMELRNLKQAALWNVTRRQAGVIMRTASCQVDSMQRTLINARAVLKEAGAVFAKLFAGLSAAELRLAIASAFDKFDVDRSGFLDRGELKDAFEMMGLRLSYEEIQVLLNEYDVDGSGKIELAEFESMVRLGLKRADPHAAARAAAADQAKREEAASKVQNFWRRRKGAVEGDESFGEEGGEQRHGFDDSVDGSAEELADQTIQLAHKDSSANKTAQKKRSPSSTSNKRVALDASGRRNVPVLGTPGGANRGGELFRRALSDGAVTEARLQGSRSSIMGGKAGRARRTGAGGGGGGGGGGGAAAAAAGAAAGGGGGGPGGGRDGRGGDRRRAGGGGEHQVGGDGECGEGGAGSSDNFGAGGGGQKERKGAGCNVTASFENVVSAGLRSGPNAGSAAGWGAEDNPSGTPGQRGEGGAGDGGQRGSVHGVGSNGATFSNEGGSGSGPGACGNGGQGVNSGHGSHGRGVSRPQSAIPSKTSPSRSVTGTYRSSRPASALPRTPSAHIPSSQRAIGDVEDDACRQCGENALLDSHDRPLIRLVPQASVTAWKLPNHGEIVGIFPVSSMDAQELPASVEAWQRMSPENTLPQALAGHERSHHSPQLEFMRVASDPGCRGADDYYCARAATLDNQLSLELEHTPVISPAKQHRVPSVSPDPIAFVQISPEQKRPQSAEPHMLARQLPAGPSDRSPPPPPRKKPAHASSSLFYDASSDLPRAASKKVAPARSSSSMARLPLMRDHVTLSALLAGSRSISQV